MIDQSQTSQPKLTPEEELDVLESVYKIGKEKGLDLLRPDQMKKLTDAGRVGNDEVMSLKNIGVEMMGKIIEGMVVDLMNVISDKLKQGVSFEQWESYSFEEVDEAVRLMFFSIFGAQPEQMRDRIMTMVDGSVGES